MGNLSRPLPTAMLTLWTAAAASVPKFGLAFHRGPELNVVELNGEADAVDDTGLYWPMACRGQYDRAGITQL